MNNTKNIVIAALMAALTAAATLVIQIPTPLHGYVHPGDGLVLLCGIILGPMGGALAAGIGSMLADIFSGYLLYAPATFMIKALAAAGAGLIFRKALQNKKTSAGNVIRLILSSIVCSIVVTGGYFIFESILYGTATSAANIVFNLLQNFIGILVAFILFPIFLTNPELKAWITQSTHH